MTGGKKSFAENAEGDEEVATALPATTVVVKTANIEVKGVKATDAVTVAVARAAAGVDLPDPDQIIDIILNCCSSASLCRYNSCMRDTPYLA